MVSNHGGRVLDQCPATAEVLEEIADAVGDSMKILVDGGIRSGTDIFKALAQRLMVASVDFKPHDKIQRLPPLPIAFPVCHIDFRPGKAHRVLVR